MKLREHQERGVSDLRHAFASHKRVCYVAPTGSGKTRLAAEIIRLATARGRRTVFFAPRIELIDQTAATLRRCGVENVRVIQAENDNGGDGVIVASIPTMTTGRWLSKLPDADLVIWDECHGIRARTHNTLADRYFGAHQLGLTATPARGDGQSLRSAFDAIVVGPTIGELVALGLLVPCRVFAPPAIMKPREIAMEPVDAFERHCAGRRTIVFAQQVEHAAKLAEQFRARGHRAEFVSGEMTGRSDVIARYAAGEFDVLINVAILIQGWDDPPTSAAIFARKFTHPGPYLQACGRILRPHSGKTDAVAVDLCGSALVHGTPDVDREYTLDGKTNMQADRLAIRQCSACGGVSTGRDACPYCSAEFPTATRALPTSADIGVDELPRTKPTSWPMRAKKHGLCAGCGRQILPGTWIVYSKLRRLAVHTGCSGEWARRAA